MAKTNHEGFKTVETDLEELDEKIRDHRRGIFWRVVWVVGIFAVMLIAFGLWEALRVYEDYEVTSSVERTDSEASRFEEFCGNIVKYSNDGIVYMDGENELIWNQSFEMNTPRMSKCENYMAIYDMGGTDIFIISDSGVQREIETTMPIRKVCVARQGTIAVLLKEGTVSYVKLYDRKGKELASGAFYGNQGGFPIDIAFSYDAQKLAVDMVDVADGNMKSTIAFYNFGSVGQNEINNNVGTYSYSDVFIPLIEYVSDERMLAFGDKEIIVFGGAQKPEISKEIFIEGEMESVFYDEKYIGITQSNHDEANSKHITIYDMRGNRVMETETDMPYENIGFLSNHEVCLTSKYECEIYTIHSVKKFSYTFDEEIYKILYRGIGSNYIFIMDGATEEVRLI